MTGLDGWKALRTLEFRCVPHNRRGRFPHLPALESLSCAFESLPSLEFRSLPALEHVRCDLTWTARHACGNRLSRELASGARALLAPVRKLRIDISRAYLQRAFFSVTGQLFCWASAHASLQHLVIAVCEDASVSSSSSSSIPELTGCLASLRSLRRLEHLRLERFGDVIGAEHVQPLLDLPHLFARERASLGHRADQTDHLWRLVTS